jgi:hypothetical protein
MYRTFIPARGLPAGWDILAGLLATKWRRMDSLVSGENFTGRYLLISKDPQAVRGEPALAFDVPL